MKRRRPAVRRIAVFSSLALFHAALSPETRAVVARITVDGATSAPAPTATTGHSSMPILAAPASVPRVCALSVAAGLTMAPAPIVASVGMGAPPASSRPPLIVDVTYDLKTALRANQAGDAHAARRVRAENQIRTVEEAWRTGESLAPAQAPLPEMTPREHIALKLEHAATLHERAASVQSRTLIGKLAARWVLRPRARQLRRQVDEILAAQPDWSQLIEQKHPHDRRELLEELKHYVPGLDPGRVVSGFGLLGPDLDMDGSLPLGQASKNYPDEKGLVWIVPHDNDAEYIHIAVHEGIHHGDRGYRMGVPALELLLGENDGQALAVALIEGFTEWRTRRVLDQLQEKAADGGKGAPALFVQGLKKLFKGSENPFLEFRNGLVKENYHPFVLATEAILALEGGREALDAFVSRGDTAPLSLLLGHRKLVLMARVARGVAQWNESLDSNGRFLSRETGLNRWLHHGLAEIVKGERLDENILSSRERAVAKILKTLEEKIRATPSFARQTATEALAKLELEELLSTSVDVAPIAAEIDRALAAHGWRRYLPDAFNDWRDFSYLGSFAAFILPTLGALYHFARSSHDISPILTGIFILSACFPITGAALSLQKLRENTDYFLAYLLRAPRPAKKRARFLSGVLIKYPNGHDPRQSEVD